MEHRRISVVAKLTALWVVVVTLWPVPSNVAVREERARRTASSGEGLYMSDITEAQFGLLGARFYETSEGQRSWNIRSEFAELHRQKDDYAFLKKVDADFFAGHSGNIVHTTSDYGRSHFMKRLVELEGNVIVRSKQGYRMNLPRLDYDSARHEFRSAEMVHMVGPDASAPEMFLTGRGLHADLNEESFSTKQQTRARRKLAEDSWMHVQSVRGEFLPQRNRAVFSDGVKAQLPEIAVQSDRMEMGVGATENDVMRATGRVLLWHKNRQGRSDSADIELGGDRIVLEGEATVISEDNELHGRRITLYVDDDRVEVEQAHGSTAP